MFSITPKLQKRLEWLHVNNHPNSSFEKVCKMRIRKIKPFYDFAMYCMEKNDGPYNPDKQDYFMRVYDCNDNLTKEEFKALSKYNQVQYVLYHRWKNGEITKEQLKNFDWIELMFGKL